MSPSLPKRHIYGRSLTSMPTRPFFELPGLFAYIYTDTFFTFLVLPFLLCWLYVITSTITCSTTAVVAQKKYIDLLYDRKQLGGGRKQLLRRRRRMQALAPSLVLSTITKILIVHLLEFIF